MSAVAAPRLALSGHDLYLFREGTHSRLYQKLGAHLVEGATEFAVWAPNAASVAVVGDFNGWDPRRHPMRQASDASGIWYARVPEAHAGQHLQVPHRVQARGLQGRQGRPVRVSLRDAAEDRLDGLGPRLRMARRRVDAHARPAQRARRAACRSTRCTSARGDALARSPERFLGYRELAPQLADYAKRMGFTHVELMPIIEHPFYGSWGYQTTGYFAAEPRYGTPQDFMYFVDHAAPGRHRRDPRLGAVALPERRARPRLLRRHASLRARRPAPGRPSGWGSAIFNYGRNEVRAFLRSSALFWLDKYHIDGLRVDAVASMLYLDYGRKEGEWIPNRYGGRENLEAIEFLRFLNEAVYRDFPDIADHRRGIDRVAAGVAADLPRRPRLRPEVEHGLDARHARLLQARPGPPQVSPRRAHLQPVVRLPRELRAAALARRSGARQGLADRQDAGRRRGSSSPTCGCCSATCGRTRARSCCSWAASSASGASGRTTRASSGTCCSIRCTTACSAGWPTSTAPYREKPALHEHDFSPDGFDWVERGDWEQSVLSFLRLAGDGGAAGARGVQLHAGAAPQLPRRRAARRLLARAPEQRRRDLRRQRPGQLRRRRGARRCLTRTYGHSLTLTLPPLAAVFLKPD